MRNLINIACQSIRSRPDDSASPRASRRRCPSGFIAPGLAALGLASLLLACAGAGGSQDRPEPNGLAAPSLSSPGPHSFVQGMPITDVVFANSGGDVQAGGCAIDASGGAGLPAGLSLNTYQLAGKATCAITGTPMAPSSGPISLTVLADNSAGRGSLALMISVAPAAPELVDIATPLVFEQGAAITPVDFSNTGGDVEPGGCRFSLDANSVASRRGLIPEVAMVEGKASCRVSGIPAAASGGAIRLAVFGRNSSGESEAYLSFQVNPAAPEPPILRSSDFSLAQGALLTGFNLINSGDSISRGSCAVADRGDPLPAGLDLSDTLVEGVRTCRISGVPIAILAQPAQVVITSRNEAGGTFAEFAIGVIANTAVTQPPQLENLSRQLLSAGTEIEPIIFVNNGGTAENCAPAPSSRLPANLIVEEYINNNKVSCAITGIVNAPIDMDMTVGIAASNRRGVVLATVIISTR